MAIALKATSDDVKNAIFSNLSKRLVTMIKEDMDFMGPVRMNDVEEAQQISVIKYVDSQGVTHYALSLNVNELVGQGLEQDTIPGSIHDIIKLRPASNSELGGVIIGNNFTVDERGKVGFYYPVGSVIFFANQDFPDASYGVWESEFVEALNVWKFTRVS